MKVIAVGIALALVVMTAPAVAPALEPYSFAGLAEAKPCVVGSSDHCVVKRYCVTEPCPDWP